MEKGEKGEERGRRRESGEGRWGYQRRRRAEKGD